LDCQLFRCCLVSDRKSATLLDLQRLAFLEGRVRGTSPGVAGADDAHFHWFHALSLLLR